MASADPPLPTAADEWRARWPLVFSSFLGASLMGIGISSLGAFFAPLEAEFGWKRAEISSGLALFSVTGVLLGPLLGGMIDRFGPRWFGVLGVLGCGATFAVFGTATGSFTNWLLLWAVFSITAQTVRPLTWSAAISSEFNASRGLAMAIAFFGSGLGGLLAPLIAGELIAAFGWRSAYAIMGLGWGGLAGLVCFLFFYGRSDRLRATNTKKPPETRPAAPVTRELRSSTFLKLAASTIVANTLFVGLLVHMIPLLESRGLPRTDAIWLAALVAGAAIPGQFLCGLLADRVPGNVISAVALALMGLACGLLLTGNASVWFVLLPVTLIGLTGGERTQMLPYLVTRFFRLEDFGKIFGVIASIMALAAGIGPTLAGHVFDTTRSYDLLLMAGIPVSLIAALLVLSMGRYPQQR